MNLPRKIVEGLRLWLPGKDASPVWIKVILRGALLGIALALMLSDSRYYNLGYNALALILAVILSFYFGYLSRRRWPSALMEGLLLYVVAIAFSNLAILASASPWL